MPLPGDRERMDLGPVDIEPAFSNAFVLRDRRDELRRDATAILSTWTDGMLMVVTHGANIQALSGVSVSMLVGGFHGCVGKNVLLKFRSAGVRLRRGCST